MWEYLLFTSNVLSFAGNTGLGFETAKQLAAHNPSHIYLAARTPSKGEAAVAAIKEMSPTTKVTFLPLDLSSFESVSTAAQDFISKSDRLDVLINNAGIMAVPKGVTKEGYEVQLGTNHMGRKSFHIDILFEGQARLACLIIILAVSSFV